MKCVNEQPISGKIVEIMNPTSGPLHIVNPGNLGKWMKTIAIVWKGRVRWAHQYDSGLLKLVEEEANS